MKRLSHILVVLVLFGIVGHADGPDEQYIQIYNLIQQGDRLAASGQGAAAQSKYQDADAALKKLQSSYPNWNEQVIRFRLRYIAEKIGTPPPAAPAQTPGARMAQPDAGRAGAIDAQEAQIRALQQHIQRLEGDKAVLEAKLREALTAQPAAIDPRELARAEERIRHVEKEKELLRVALDQQKSQFAQSQDSSAVDALRANLAEANRQLTEQREIATTLAREKEILEGRIREGRDDSQLAALRAENESLRQQLEAKNPKAAVAARTDRLERELAEAKRTLKSSEKTIAQLRDERLAQDKARADLEKRLSTATANRTDKVASERIQKLEKERDDLLARLNQAAKQGRNGGNQRSTPAEAANLRAQLAALEAQKVPYTAEELALFKQPTLEPAKVAARRPATDLSGNAVNLIAEAETDFRSRRFAEAERKYEEAAKLSQSNPSTLVNLAAAQLEQNKMSDAEETLRRALDAEPNDAHAMTLMGIIQFRQTQYDDAFATLSRAAQLDPKNAETQNYLGITLSQKGQRVAAETALRKAVQLAPGYGSAHYNLAVVYATQKPPFIELARWHYQKALASGHPRNDEVEKILSR